MTLSRKEFFRQGFFALGDTVLKAAGVVRETQETLLQPALAATEPEGPGPDTPRLARAINQRCLARNCGCFACVERCEVQAITVVMGEGIRIDERLCTGCGSCEYVCPVLPKAICFVAKPI